MMGIDNKVRGMLRDLAESYQIRQQSTSIRSEVLLLSVMRRLKSLLDEYDSRPSDDGGLTPEVYDVLEVAERLHTDMTRE